MTAPVQRVTARVHPGTSVSPAASAQPSPRSGAAPVSPVRRRELALPAAVATCVVVAGGGAPAAVVAAALAVALRRARRVSVRSRFGFGDGFLPYHPDDGWPPGVQEDDDLHWRWPSGR